MSLIIEIAQDIFLASKIYFSVQDLSYYREWKN
jgi:hypothetical protein